MRSFLVPAETRWVSVLWCLFLRFPCASGRLKPHQSGGMDRNLCRRGRNLCAAVPWMGGFFFFYPPRTGCRTALSRPRLLEASRQARDYHETAVACPRVKVRQQVRERRSWPFLARPPNVPVANFRAKPSKVPAYLCKPTQGGIACIAVMPFDGFKPLAWKNRLSRRARTIICLFFCHVCRTFA